MFWHCFRLILGHESVNRVSISFFQKQKCFRMEYGASQGMTLRKTMGETSHLFSSVAEIAQTSATDQKKKIKLQPSTFKVQHPLPQCDGRKKEIKLQPSFKVQHPLRCPNCGKVAFVHRFVDRRGGKTPANDAG